MRHKPGDVVCTKISTQPMTVERVVDEQIVNCVWTKDGKTHRIAVNVGVLVVLEAK